jgi:polyhydroxyalkanoate synthesis repressor PhaR
MASSGRRTSEKATGRPQAFSSPSGGLKHSDGLASPPVAASAPSDPPQGLNKSWDGPAIDLRGGTTTPPDADDAQPAQSDSFGRVIKKYPNRRLYDTHTSSYVTLVDVKKMVMEGLSFVVLEAKTGENLTRAILLQIILEEETDGSPMFSTQMLSQIIRVYGHAMQGIMGSYLERNLQIFTEVQARLGGQSQDLVDSQMLKPEVWSQFLTGQTPVVQNMMGTFIDQSQTLMQQMQEQMSQNSNLFFGGFVPGAKPSDSSDK